MCEQYPDLIACTCCPQQKSLLCLELADKRINECLHAREHLLWGRLLQHDHGVSTASISRAPSTPYRLPLTARVMYMLECLKGYDMELESIEVQLRGHLSSLGQGPLTGWLSCVFVCAGDAHAGVVHQAHLV